MRAIVQFDLKPGAVELREVPRPIFGHGEVLIQVMAVSVCGSDIHQRAGKQSWQVNVPVILGHEFSGRIVEIGPGVEGFSSGDRVACETSAVICGRCLSCRSGQYQLCRQRKGFGYGVSGAMAEFVSVPERILHRLPESVGFEEAALIEPACVAYNSVVRRGQLVLGDIIVVMGPGPIGLLCLKMAELAGTAASILIGLKNDKNRLEVGKQFGATHTVVQDEADVTKLVNHITNGDGCDLVIDATGVSSSLQKAMELIKSGGTIIKVGWGPQPMNYSLDPLVQKSADIRASFSHNFPIWEKVIRLMAHGLLDVKPLISKTYGLTDWLAAFDDMEHGPNIKSVILPNN